MFIYEILVVPREKTPTGAAARGGEGMGVHTGVPGIQASTRHGHPEGRRDCDQHPHV